MPGEGFDHSRYLLVDHRDEEGLVNTICTIYVHCNLYTVPYASYTNLRSLAAATCDCFELSSDVVNNHIFLLLISKSTEIGTEEGEMKAWGLDIR